MTLSVYEYSFYYNSLLPTPKALSQFTHYANALKVSDADELKNLALELSIKLVNGLSLGNALSEIKLGIFHAQALYNAGLVYIFDFLQRFGVIANHKGLTTEKELNTLATQLARKVRNGAIIPNINLVSRYSNALIDNSLDHNGNCLNNFINFAESLKIRRNAALNTLANQLAEDLKQGIVLSQKFSFNLSSIALVSLYKNALRNASLQCNRDAINEFTNQANKRGFTTANDLNYLANRIASDLKNGVDLSEKFPNIKLLDYGKALKDAGLEDNADAISQFRDYAIWYDYKKQDGINIAAKEFLAENVKMFGNKYLLVSTSSLVSRTMSFSAIKLAYVESTHKKSVISLNTATKRIVKQAN